ncbi:MAG: DNA phosphorothioation-dependent restriction protein DptF [Pseudomonas sp.]|nr:DNA phosphorothioation-dependent restriction protein DptF [Pseudomonas sp.]
MRFIDVLSVLSKSSPYAVSTENKYPDLNNLLDKVKKDLYVTMPIEQKVKEVMSLLNDRPRQVFFLCGSSGDGKSELLVNTIDEAEEHVRFHLDATHSFDPHENAVQTLDKLFDEFEQGKFSLVVGINVGMLGNYEQEGRNTLFKSAIKAFQHNKTEVAGFTFVSFEDYPKFEITPNGVQADFARKVMARITSPDSLLFKIYQRESDHQPDAESQRIVINYRLMCLPEVQDVIVELLFKARLVRDQFLTARGLLDFVYHLLTGAGYLFDNLFSGGDNELADKLVEFDPALLRTKVIDRFLMAEDLKLENRQFDVFCTEVAEKYDLPSLSNPKSYIRLFYILKNSELEANFTKQFQRDFVQHLLSDYLDVYRVHVFFEDTLTCREKLKAFYNKKLISALRLYINRNAPQLSNKQFLVAQLENYKIAAQLDIKPDIAAIKANKSVKPNTFFAHLKVGGELLAVEVNINLFELLDRINAGYRPSKNDRSAVILLNEVASKIALIARESSELLISSESAQYKFSQDDDYIEAEEL